MTLFIAECAKPPAAAHQSDGCRMGSSSCLYPPPDPRTHTGVQCRLFLGLLTCTVGTVIIQLLLLHR